MENNKNTEDKNLKNINSSSENVQDKIKEFQQQMDEIQNAVKDVENNKKKEVKPAETAEASVKEEAADISAISSGKPEDIMTEVPKETTSAEGESSDDIDENEASSEEVGELNADASDAVESDDVKEEVEVEAANEIAKDESCSEDSVKAEATEEVEADDNNIKGAKKPGFFRRLIASVIDQYICFGIGVILLYLFNLLLKFAGYRVSDFTTMMIIVYAIVNILYFSIMNSTKLKNTLGRKLLRC